MSDDAKMRERAEAFEWLEKVQCSVTYEHGWFLYFDGRTYEGPSLLACIQAARKGEK